MRKKRAVLVLGTLLTLFHLTIGISYSSVCESTGGARACGTTCSTTSNGSCACSGTCTADEMKWVEGAKKGDDEELLLM